MRILKFVFLLVIAGIVDSLPPTHKTDADKRLLRTFLSYAGTSVVSPTLFFIT